MITMNVQNSSEVGSNDSRSNYLTEPAHPRDDPRIDISSESGDGSGSKGDCIAAEYERVDPYWSLLNLPYNIEEEEEDDRTVYQVPKTWFKMNGAVPTKDPSIGTEISCLWRRLSRLHRDVQGTYADIDRSKNILRSDARYRRCDAILQSLGVPEWAHEYALKRVMKEKLHSYSTHGGAQAAVVGFALWRLFDDESEALDSVFAERAIDIIPEMKSYGLKRLVDYTFRNEGGEN